MSGMGNHFNRADLADLAEGARATEHMFRTRARGLPGVLPDIGQKDFVGGGGLQIPVSVTVAVDVSHIEGRRKSCLPIET